MVSWGHMTTRTLSLAGASLVLSLFVFALPAHAQVPFTLSIQSITIVKAPPTCEARSTKRWMRSGSVTEIVWESENATSMTGFTSAARVWPTEGRERVAIGFTGKHEFPLTFTGPGGTTTCIAKVFVHAKRDRR